MCPNSNECVLKRTSGHPGPGGRFGVSSVSGVIADLQKINTLSWKCSSTHKIDQDDETPVAIATQLLQLPGHIRPCPPGSPPRTLQAHGLVCRHLHPGTALSPPYTLHTQQDFPVSPTSHQLLNLPSSSKYLSVSACLNLRCPSRKAGSGLQEGP